MSQNLSTGVFTYAVQLDAAADVHVGDGFVIYDFPGLVSYTITGGLATAQFTLVSTTTSNSLSVPASVDSVANVAATTNGLPFDSGVANLSFLYNGPGPFLGSALATLTLTSSVLGGETNSVYGSVDHSGPNASVPFSFAANPVTVPTPIPEPASLSVLGMASLWLTARRRNNRAGRI